MMAIWFIIIIFYVIFTSAFLMANMVLKKSYLNFVVLSHLCEIMCFLCMLCVQLKLYEGISLQFINSAAFVFFTVSIILGYVAIKICIGLKTNKKNIAVYAAITVLNTLLSFVAPDYVVFTNKFILMGLFIYIAIKIVLKNKTNMLNLGFAAILVTFPLIQAGIGLVHIAFSLWPEENVEWGLYVLQSATYSMCLMLYSIYEIKNENNKNIKLLDEAIKMDEMRKITASGITHELKTPINIISSSIQLLNDKYIGSNDYDEKKVREYMDIMKKNSYRIIKIANNFIDINKSELGAFELNYEMCDIVNLVESIVTSSVPFAEEKGIRIIFDTNIEEFLMLCDIYKLERIVLNLISNAIKFTNKAEGLVLIDLKIENSKVYIKVKDNGEGISLERQKSIFQKFNKKCSDSNAIESSGLGLSIVKNFVDLMNGSIKLESEEGKGASFTVELKVYTSKGDVKQYAIENKRKLNVEFSDI